MSWEAWRPRRPQRIALVGILGTVIMVPVFAVDVTRNGGDLASPFVLAPILVLLGLAVYVWSRRIHVRPVDREVTLTFYVWSTAAIVVLTSIIANAGGDPRRYGLVIGTMVATQAVIYPLRGQLILLGLMAAGYVAVLLPHVPVTDIAVQLGMFSVLGILLSSVAGNLHDTYEAEAEARAAAESRAQLASAIARITATDPDEVHSAIVRGIRDLGFTVAYLGVRRGERLEIVAQSESQPASGLGFDLDQSIAGVALAEARTVSIPDQQALTADGRPGAAIAVPIRDVDRIVGVLYAATDDVGDLDATIVDTVEVFGAQAGRALSIARLYAQERQTVERLTELDAMKGDFITNVSHELRTPLTVIRGLGETMAGRWADLEPPTALALLERVNANSQRLEAMIRALLDFSRFEAGAAEVHAAPTSITELSHRVVDRMQPLFDGREVEVAVEEVVVEVDPPMLEHVLENLLGNALRHTPEGTPLAILGQAAPDGLHVTVADDGPGIAAEDLEHLTERFYRGGDINHRPSGGLGLGLALCQQILEAHGSGLEVSSPEGEGARFSFWLPAVPSSPTGPTRPAPTVDAAPA